MNGVFGRSVCLALAWVMAAASCWSQAPQLPSIECVRMLREARIAGMEGDTARELTTLREAAEAFPQDIAPIYALLVHHQLHPLPEEEYARFRALLALRLEDSTQDLPVAALQSIMTDPAADDETLTLLAAHVARRLTAGSGEAVDLLQAQALLQDRLGDRDGAAEALARLHTIEPSEATRWALYRSYVVLERWTEALAILEEMLADDTEGHLRHAHVHLLGKAGRVEEQTRVIEHYVREPPPGETAKGSWLGTLIGAAWDLRDAGRDQEARALFEKILELHPENERTRTLLVHLYGSDGERAELAAREASRWRGEDDPVALFDAGTERLASGDAEGAVELLRRAAPELPDLEAAWYNLGMAAYRIEDWRTADQAFARAAALNPTRAENFFFRGMALSQSERCGDAVVALERALALDAGRTLAHYYLASCYKNLGDAAAAERHRDLYARSIE